MRITGGFYCGRTVKCPPGEIRPAMDRMRVSLFAILGPLDGLSFLDLFSGSGVVAIEALSRGAIRADLVERDRGKKSVLEKNLSWVKEPWQLHFSSVEKFLLTSQGKQWDIVYCDPPFALERKQSILEGVIDKKLIRNNGILLMHHPTEEILPDVIFNYTKYDLRKYGGSSISFFKA